MIHMNAYEEVKKLIEDYKTGEIENVEVLKLKAQPIIDKMNETNRAIAKKHNMKPKLVNFQSIMRNTY